MGRRIKKGVFITSFTLFCIVGILVLSFQIFKAQFDAKKVLREMHSKNVFPTSTMIPYYEDEIHATYVGDLSKPKVVLIHGSPGYWYDFKNIFTDQNLLDNYCIISYDRPGYGKTSVSVKKRLSDQAKIAEAVMNHFAKDEEKFTVLGHSYGGAVLEQTILDYQDKISHAIYIAPCLSPEFQKAKWYNLLVSGGLPNKIMPHELRISNLEMLALEEDLGKNEKRLKEIHIPTTYIQGKKDILVPYQTQEYYLKHHKNVNYSLLEDQDHFIPWSNPDLIIKAIQEKPFIGSVEQKGKELQKVLAK
ncbi:alpha/beta hydrolase [Labilibaculum sp. DW002]|jgi:pimeloyl-ACP methyl ester carboxylesterase|uniref:Alpha/beta hydrolase n=1 Tax=Paralabilibaculum antarcticum TaxID=2912572 RepID=A0ABT5VWT8_9BACT|nr:alpha/beta hydrolase [Labilibaculum sp. DW002]MDE5419715.1 alpha/beta hydrolase [Labilibaculum sp. DW002]